jgi:hypothetical protein
MPPSALNKQNQVEITCHLCFLPQLFASSFTGSEAIGVASLLCSARRVEKANTVTLTTHACGRFMKICWSGPTKPRPASRSLYESQAKTSQNSSQFTLNVPYGVMVSLGRKEVRWRLGHKTFPLRLFVCNIWCKQKRARTSFYPGPDV